MTSPNIVDLMHLPGEEALEALYDMKKNGSKKKLGTYVLSKLITVGADPIDGTVSVSAQLDTGQSLSLHFGYHDHPTIDARYQVLGKNRGVTTDIEVTVVADSSKSVIQNC